MAFDEQLADRIRDQRSIHEDLSVHPAVMGGRPMGGWVQVDESALRTARQLDRWVQMATEHVRSLPPKGR